MNNGICLLSEPGFSGLQDLQDKMSRPGNQRYESCRIPHAYSAIGIPPNQRRMRQINGINALLAFPGSLGQKKIGLENPPTNGNPNSFT